MIKIELPNSDNPLEQIEKCIEILNEIEVVALREKELVLDLSELRWILPCSDLLLSSKVIELQNRGYKISFVSPKDHSVVNYLAIVGFPFGGGKSKDTFMPIHHFSRKDNEDSTKIVEAEMEEVFKVVENNFPSGLVGGILYLVAEMADNIDQHSNFTQGSIMIQFYKNKGHVDIGIFDNGITIPGVYEKNKVEFENDCDAIRKALRGISTKEGEIGRGKGLGTSQKLVNMGLEGDFYILSRNCLYGSEYGKNPESKSLEKPLKGTLIYMRFKAPKKSLNIYPYLE